MHRRRVPLWMAAALLALGCSGSHPGHAPPPAPPASSIAANAANPGAPPAAASSAPAPEPPPAPGSPPLAVDGTLPNSVMPPLVERADCGEGVCTRTHMVPDELLRGLAARGPVAVWEESIGGNAEVVFPADKGIELAGVVIEGGIDVLPQEKDMVDRPLGTRWLAFRAPGAGLSLAPLKGRRGRIVMALSVVGPETSLAKHVEQWDKDKSAFTWTERQKRIDKIDFDTKEDLAWVGDAYHARVGWEASKYRYSNGTGKGAKTWEVDDQPAMVMSLIKWSRNAPVGQHIHDKERECLVILQGAGELDLWTNGAGAPPRPVMADPGMVACIPAGMPHAWKPAGTLPFFAIQVYTPPGPEQRYKKLAGKAP